MRGTLEFVVRLFKAAGPSRGPLCRRRAPVNRRSTARCAYTSPGFLSSFIFFLFQSCIRLSQHHTVHFIASGIACGEVIGDEAIPGLAATRAMASAGSGWFAAMDLAQLRGPQRSALPSTAVESAGGHLGNISMAATRYRVGEQGGQALGKERWGGDLCSVSHRCFSTAR